MAAVPQVSGAYPADAAPAASAASHAQGEETFEVAVGDRVKSAGSHATVKWVGRLPGQGDTVWAGVDFDDQERGKHDGSHQGVRYFEARAAKSGSFAKLAKLEPRVTLQAALAARYDGAGCDEELKVVDYVTGKLKELNFVGREKAAKRQQDLGQLTDAALMDEGIFACGDIGVCKRLESLVLSDNLLASWQPVVDLLRQLPALQTLELTNNALGACDVDFGTHEFGLKTLALNGCRVSWADVARLRCCPQLKELHLRANELGPPEGDYVLEAVETLVLDGNALTQWEPAFRAINRMFPGLRSLQLTGNPLGDEVGEVAVPKALKALFVDDTQLSTWPALAALTGQLAQLVELRLARCPLASAHAAILRAVCIAVLPDLKDFNGGTVSQKERTSAERHFLSLCLQGHEAVQAVAPSHRERLTALHGEGIQGAQVTTLLKDSLVELEFVPLGSRILTSNPVKKRVPNTLDISDLKVLVSKLYKGAVPVEHMRLTAAEAGALHHSVLEDGTLATYSVYSACQVRVEDSRDDWENKK